MLTASAFAQTAKEANGQTPFVPDGQEPPAKLIVDPPISLALAHGSALIQYRAENVRISPVFGPAALNVFPRVGHLHINVSLLSVIRHPSFSRCLIRRKGARLKLSSPLNGVGMLKPRFALQLGRSGLR